MSFLYERQRIGMAGYWAGVSQSSIQCLSVEDVI